MIIINLVILITVQIYYVLTLSPLINCTDCDILNFFINKSRTNALSKQEDIGSQLNIRMCETNNFIRLN
jgi:hypothetical protein